MDLVSVSLIGCSLAMDAFAAAVCYGISQKSIRLWPTLKVGLFFGGAQFLMPVVGYIVGRTFISYIEAVDHWIAFGLLAFIGGKMMLEARKDEPEKTTSAATPQLLLLSLVTSIDALAVGVSLGMVGGNILRDAAIIGVITLMITCLGVALGKTLGLRFRQKAQLLGGLVLVLLGIRVLAEHLL